MCTTCPNKLIFMAKGNCQSTEKHTKQFLMKIWKDDISLKTYNPTADSDNDQQIIMP